MIDVLRGLHPMKHQQIAKTRKLQFQKAFAPFYADSFEYCEEHLAFLRRRRDAFIATLKA